jgi:hypothetical protein
MRCDACADALRRCAPSPLAPSVLYLLEDLGCDINAPGEQGYTPLHLAAKFNYPKLVEMLLRRGARTDMLTKDEKTARDLAGAKQERSHAQMGDMLALFNRYDAEARSRPKLPAGAPLPPDPRLHQGGAVAPVQPPQPLHQRPPQPPPQPLQGGAQCSGERDFVSMLPSHRREQLRAAVADAADLHSLSSQEQKDLAQDLARLQIEQGGVGGGCGASDHSGTVPSQSQAERQVPAHAQLPPARHQQQYQQQYQQLQQQMGKLNVPQEAYPSHDHLHTQHQLYQPQPLQRRYDRDAAVMAAQFAAAEQRGPSAAQSGIHGSMNRGMLSAQDVQMRGPRGTMRPDQSADRQAAETRLRAQGSRPW